MSCIFLRVNIAPLQQSFCQRLIPPINEHNMWLYLRFRVSVDTFNFRVVGIKSTQKGICLLSMYDEF